MWCPFVSWLDFSPDEFFLIFFAIFCRWTDLMDHFERTDCTTNRWPHHHLSTCHLQIIQSGRYGFVDEFLRENERYRVFLPVPRRKQNKQSADLRSRASYAKSFNRSFGSFHSCFIVGFTWPFSFRKLLIYTVVSIFVSHVQKACTMNWTRGPLEESVAANLTIKHTHFARGQTWISFDHCFEVWKFGEGGLWGLCVLWGFMKDVRFVKFGPKCMGLSPIVQSEVPTCMYI